MRKHLGQLVLLIMLLFYAGRCWAQTAAPEGAFESQHELVVGTKEAPPFSMKTADGTWTGVSIDLWRRVADELHLHYRFAEEANVQGLIDGVADCKFDIAAVIGCLPDSDQTGWKSLFIFIRWRLSAVLSGR